MGKQSLLAFAGAICIVSTLVVYQCWASPGGLNLTKGKSVISFDYTAEEIGKLCKTTKADVETALNKVASVSTDEATFANTVLAMEVALVDLLNKLEPANFLKYVSPNKELRDAAGECETTIEKLYVDIFAREDLYKPIKAAFEKDEKLGPIEAKLLKEYVTDFKRNGLDLSTEERKLYTTKKKRLVELTTEFSKTLNEWKDPLAVTKAELDGMPEDFIKGLAKTEDGKYLVTMSYPNYYPFMQNAKNADARKRLQFKFFNRGGAENTARLEEAITLRDEMAKILGYENHAAFQLEKRMALKPEKVLTFLSRIKEKLKTLGQADLKEMVEYKRKELGDPTISKIEAWDWRYYANQIKKIKYQVDEQAIKEYFPLEVVNKGMFEIYETLLGVKFEATTDVPVWHESVLAYAVKSQEDKVLAYFFMDLFPREGKYKHAAAFTLRKGYATEDGYHIPVSSIVANYNAPVEGQPSLLTHSQVETQFHEFGHIMHQVLTQAKYASFSGTSVKRDFVEAPSQMLENWVWKKESLTKLSGHYKDPSKPLPDELLNSLVKAKLANVGIKYLRQIFFGLLDMTYHTSDKVDSTAVYKQLSGDVMLIPIPDGTQPQASFGHLMGGYDAGYYGYLWSEVYAQDMFTRFESEGLLSSTAGAAYRKWILEPGGSIEPLELITSFIGREPIEDAFLKSLGLESPSPAQQKPRAVSQK